MWNYKCQHCGANLDPQEQCTCKKEEEERAERLKKKIKEERNGQLVFIYD